MYIEELIIDGFKSYATRTHITGWDRQFNAITGLNGSGKSNILDAICFVLGITNLSHVRANSLQDLVYKRGQAGISKASVTIVFNNSDTKNSPVGYEEYQQITVTRQILIGGRNKYLINGHNAQQQTLANLFQSVQLNVNNPHFLIMQGKITKVLNMKPPEILAMIQEAAGTRMFEEKKEKALKTIAKKEVKLAEIQTLLDEEITPKLNQLRQEKATYLQYQTVQIEMDQKNKLMVAFKYHKNEMKMKSSGMDFDDKKGKIIQIENRIEQTQREISTIEEEISRIQETRVKGENVEKLEKVIKEKTKSITIHKAELDNVSKNLNEEMDNLKSNKRNQEELIKSIEKHIESNKELQKRFKMKEEEFRREENELQRSEELLQSLTTGISAKEGHKLDYHTQIQTTKKEKAKYSTEIEKLRLQIEHLAKENKRLKQRRNDMIDENHEQNSTRNKAQQELTVLEDKIEQLGYDPQKQHEYSQLASELSKKIKEANESKQIKIAERGNLEFKYSDPYPNFDRSKVKGLVAELFSLDDKQYATALEICAGGKLYNVIVDDSSTGADLLKNGNLRSRVTIIPLNKISTFKLSAEKIATSNRIAPGQVNLALSLVGYKNELEKAMEYVFGSTLICDTPNVSREISSVKRIAKSVTIEGDVYDPSGTLQGGAKPTVSGIIESFAAIQEINKQLSSLTENRFKIMKKVESMAHLANEYHQLKKKVDLKKHEIELLDQRLANSSYNQVQIELEANEKNLIEAEGQIGKCEAKVKELDDHLLSLEKEMSDFKDNKSLKLEELESKIKQLKKGIAAKKTTFKSIQFEVNSKEKELELMKADLENVQESFESIEKNIKKLKNSHEVIKNEYISDKNELATLKESMDILILEQRKEDKEINDLIKVKQNKNKDCNENKLQLQKLQHEIERFEKDIIEAERIVKALEREHEWISEYKSTFGQSGTDFDFQKHDIRQVEIRLQSLEKEHEVLRRKINLKVMTLIDSQEKKESELKSMLNRVKKDKITIENSIQTLDNFKKEALSRTWEKVDNDFGLIFSDLLPGNGAKLIPPEGKELKDGLEVRVNLGGVWKHSLTELSGGQRSLIALSLILALLQFKPAPMYILDEIDAALDLSHTQNIGQLLRTRFKASQFIIVSLKDGMFNNANVLFKAKFRDGISLVERVAARR